MNLPYTQAYAKIQEYAAQNPSISPSIHAPSGVYLHQKKHQLEFIDTQTGALQQIFRLPLPFLPIAPDEQLWQYAARLPQALPPYAIVLMQAGSAALGYFEGGTVVQHKVIKKYMVRAKQGRAELLQQQIKPRHSVGSRLRLQNSYSFFEEINEKLCLWHKHYAFQNLFYTCPINFLQYWHGAKCPPPIARHSPYLKKIPTHTHTPNFEILLQINEYCIQAHIDFL
jgi:hypothetical protein